MQYEYIQEIENHIKNNNIKESLELLELMKLEKMDITKYEEKILFMNDNSKIINLDNSIDKMQNITNRIKYAKELVNDMETKGNNILETLNDNNEKIKNINNKVNKVNDNISYANIITKRIQSIFNRY